MKKHNYLYLSALSVSLFMGSCTKDFLQRDPESIISASNFFSNESQVKQAVNGAYNSVLQMGLADYWIFGEMRSDNTTFHYNNTNRGLEQRELMEQFVSQATDEPLSTFWQRLYTGIDRANEVLDHIGTVNMPDANKNQYTGEMKFLRAFHYFTLVRQWGGVPLRITSTQTTDQTKSKGRASVDDIYTQIIADLTDAASKLPKKYTGADVGRATEGAARTMLAEVYLTRKKTTEALTELRKVEAIGYQLLPSYAAIFDPANKNNAESIFEIQYLGSDPQLSSTFMYQFAPWTSGSAVTKDPKTTSNPGGWNIPTQDLIDAYDSTDLRKNISIGTDFISMNPSDPLKGKMIPYIKKYNHAPADIGRTNDNFPVYRYADVLLMIAECLNESGDQASSLTYLNRVHAHSRTGLLPIAVIDQATLRDLIFKERQVELAFENHRWYDLVRSGKAVAVMNANGAREKLLKPTQPYPIGSYNVNPNKLLLLIPQKEVTLDNLAQNPQ